MHKKTLFAEFAISVFIVSVVVGFQGAGLANANSGMPLNLPYIYINADGNVDPLTAPIHREGRIYSLTADIFKHTLVPQCDNIVIDGADHTLSSDNNSGPAILMQNRLNVSIENFKLNSFAGSFIEMGGCSSCTIAENVLITDNGGAMTLNGCNKCRITNNTLYNEGNGEIIFCSDNDNTFSGNNFYGGDTAINLYGTDNIVVQNNFIDIRNYTVYNQGQYSNTIENNNITNNQSWQIPPNPSPNLSSSPTSSVSQSPSQNLSPAPSPSIPEISTLFFLIFVLFASVFLMVSKKGAKHQ